MKSLYITTTELLHVFAKNQISVITPTTLAYLFPQTTTNTRYALLKRLLQKGFISPIKPGAYLLANHPLSIYQIAQILVPQSYISLETALNYYGILSQFPQTITSVTPAKSRQFDREVTYSFSHIKPELYHGYQLVDKCLMATPEKALIDYLYLASKGLRNPNIDELDLSSINKKELIKYPWSQPYAEPRSS